MACRVVAVPATATNVRASRIGTARSTSSSTRSISRPSAARSSADGGSACTSRSLSRTLPICVEMACSAWPGLRAQHELRWSPRRCPAPGRARAPRQVQPVGPAQERQPGLALARDDLRAPCLRADERRRRTRRGSTRRARRWWPPPGCARPPARGRAGSTGRSRPACAPTPPGRAGPCDRRPCPSRVITMSRASSVGASGAAAPGSSTSSRHEFVPWSMAATAPRALGVDRLDPRGHPRAHGIPAAGEVVGVVRVEAFDPRARPAHAAPRPGLGKVRRSVLRVRAVRGLQRLVEGLVVLDAVVELGDPALGLDPRHGLGRRRGR